MFKQQHQSQPNEKNTLVYMQDKHKHANIEKRIGFLEATNQ